MTCEGRGFSLCIAKYSENAAPGLYTSATARCPGAPIYHRGLEPVLYSPLGHFLERVPLQLRFPPGLSKSMT